jgi:hypothetical protein
MITKMIYNIINQTRMTQTFTLETAYSSEEVKELIDYPSPHPLIYVYFAESKNSALIMVKHLNKLRHIITWNTETDEFTPGQWLRHGRIRNLRISSCGEYMNYKLERFEPENYSKGQT